MANDVCLPAKVAGMLLENVGGTNDNRSVVVIGTGSISRATEICPSRR
jgi:hypothetical protein